MLSSDGSSFTFNIHSELSCATKVLVITSMGAPANLLCHCLDGVPEDSESLDSFLRIFRNFLLFKRLGFGETSGSGLKGWGEVIS